MKIQDKASTIKVMWATLKSNPLEIPTHTSLTKQCAYSVGIASKYLGTMYLIDHFNSSGGQRPSASSKKFIDNMFSNFSVFVHLFTLAMVTILKPSTLTPNFPCPLKFV